MGESKRPSSSGSKNILLLIADDLGKQLGCYGSKTSKTPNIDRLAAGGATFDMAFASTASCSPSRSVIYTGLHTHENGQYGLQGGCNHFQCFDHIETAPRLFNALGYRTGIIGKVHVGPPSVFPWHIREESESRNVTWVAERGEAFFREARQSGQPFFLTVGYIDPHRDIKTRGGFGNAETCDGKVVPSDINPDELEVPPYLTDLPETRTEYAEYHRAISRLDAGIGMMLDSLERQGLADSTLVVFCSDNGPPFINSKTTLYDAGTRLPFIVRQPGLSHPGIMNPNMVSYIDALPTFLDWAGAPSNFSAAASAAPEQVTTLETRSPPPPTRLGQSFLPILHRSDVVPESEWQHSVHGSHTFHEVTNYWPTRILRSRRFKYHRNIAWQLPFPFASDLYASLTFEGIRNQRDRDDFQSSGIMIGTRPLKNYIHRPAEELYDLENDPQEVRNLARDKDFEATLKQMRQTVERWQFRTKDPWLYKDGQSILAMERYVDTEHVDIPDRFDFEVDQPGNRDGVRLFEMGTNA
jgi:N-sulfoglucosamine sulfohydrolase